MATKEQLARIFALEIQSMQDEIEALDRIAKRQGNLRDPARRETDRQVGLAYRLLQEYGATEELSFAQGSETREALLEAGAAEGDIPFIAAAYQGERADALSSRNGQTRSPFLQDVLHRMAQVGLDDTVLNREATTEEIFRARTDALLASSDDPRKPRLGKTDKQEQPPVEAILVAPTPRPTPIWDADPEPVPAIEPHGIVAEPVPEVQPAIPQPKPTNSAKPRTNLPLSEFDSQLEDLIANKQDEWEEDTASDVRVLVDIFRGILEEHDVTHTGEITQEHIAALRQHFNHILPSYGRSPRLRALSPRELREESRRRAEEAEAKGENPVRLGLKPATIRRHLGNLDHFLKHLRASHIMVGEWTFEGLRPKKPSKGLTRLQQVKPGPSEVRPLFDIPIFTGQKSAEEPGLAGELTFHSAVYFLPMLYAYLGSRRNEFAGLQVNEIVERDGHWAIQIKLNEDRRIKNPQSHRLLPVPNELLRLNFIDYVERLGR